MTRLLFILLFGLALSQEPVDGDSSFNRHNLSVGMWDDKTGISLIGYTYNIKQDRMNEYFIGAGTAILAFTGTVGWKHYYRRSDKISIYSVFSEQAVGHLGFTGFMSTGSVSLEYNLTKWAQVKLGGVGIFIIRTDEDTMYDTMGLEYSWNKMELGAFPFMVLNFSF